MNQARSAVERTAAVAAAGADAHRREWAFVLAATVRLTRDLDLGEECAQDAFAQALTSWAADGVPARPGAWLTTVARRRALDALHHETVVRRTLPLLVADDVEPGVDEIVTQADGEIPDDRLRLVCTCCHPALARETQVALTLRLVCGLTTAEVARAFLVSEPTMAARITRAKKKIVAARIPYRVPAAADLPARIDAVLEVVHLLFTTGHTAPVGADLVRRDVVGRAPAPVGGEPARRALVEGALDLTRMLRTLLPGNADVAGLLALLLLTDARRETRVDAEGRRVGVGEEDAP